MQCRASGENIVDDDIACVWIDLHFLGDSERTGDILASLLPAEAGLGNRLMLFAEEEFRPAAGDMFRQDAGDPFRLVIAAVEPAGGMQRDRHEYRAGEVAAEDVVRERRMGEVVGQ